MKKLRVGALARGYCKVPQQAEDLAYLLAVALFARQFLCLGGVPTGCRRGQFKTSENCAASDGVALWRMSH